MFLHEDKNAFEYLLTNVSAATGIDEGILEKDYYVVLFLEELSQKQKNGLPAYFKGGTALYKRLKNAIRFSEDIDLSVDTRGCSGSQNKKRLELATKKYSVLTRNLQEGESYRSTVTSYYDYSPAEEFDADDSLQRFGKVKIEATSFTISEPVTSMEITPLIYDLSTEAERRILEDQYEVSPFMIQVISLERIFIDKLFAAEAYVRKSSEGDRAFEASKHIFDLSIMMDMPEIKKFLKDETAMKHLLDIRMEEETGRLDGIPGVKPSEFIIFSDAARNEDVKRAYSQMQRVYVFDRNNRISFEKAMGNLLKIQKELERNDAWKEYRPSLLKRLEAAQKIAADTFATAT